MSDLFKTDVGRPYPLGATYDGKGVNFALFSSSAQKVMLCLFDDNDEEVERLVMSGHTDEVFHIYVQGLLPGQKYGYRVFGEYAPEKGLRFNHNKLLLDPYAKALTDGIFYHETMLGYRKDHGDLSFDRRNSAPFMPKCVVVDLHEMKSKKPQIPWNETIIYESHLKGFTELMTDIPEKLRGTCAGMSTMEAVSYLKSLGISSVEFLPLFAFYTSGTLKSQGLANYWGYDPVCFMAPHVPYLSQNKLDELRTMIRVLHEAGIEVIFDVVYNHTGEGNQEGPTLSFRGIDNQAYYRLNAQNPRYYDDTTGCGASLNTDHPRVLQMVMDSLRYWTTEMDVDGFRFDLASTVARNENNSFSWRSGFLSAVQQDPDLQHAKMIAEPWDLGFDGYKVGSFPAGWGEWNDRYRDTVRRFWKSDSYQTGDLAFRLTGSSDLFDHNARKTWGSINFVTAHDGFTLRDLTSYNGKHNEANREENRDGTDSNWSWNSGEEGDTQNEDILDIRRRRARAMMTTLMLSQGVPMILSGDEFNHTQYGNNNVYCQDNELSWFPWEEETGPDMKNFVKRLIEFRKKYAIFHQEDFLTGKYFGRTDLKDVMWFTPFGYEMRAEDWKKESAVLGYMLHRGDCGKINEHVFVLMNATGEKIDWKMPDIKSLDWEVVFGSSEEPEGIFKNGDTISVEPWSILVLSSENEIQDEYFRQKREPLLFEKRPVSTESDVQDLDRLDFMIYGPLGPVDGLNDFDM